MNIMKVTVIDYGMGNIFSVTCALKSLGCEVVVTNKKEIVEKADSLILPGVGAFKDALNELTRLGLIDIIREKAMNGTPLLGICLGMQLLLDESEEFGTFKGLGLIPGIVQKFPNLSSKDKIFRIPHIGWNSLKIMRPNEKESDIFKSLKDIGEHLYFVHSYYANLVPKENIYSLTEYEGFEYCSAVRSKNIFGVQFHPEKSSVTGLKILKEFINIKK